MAEWGLYCDESGNTGRNFADRAQPVFIEAGWYVRHAESRALAEKIEELEKRSAYTKAEVKGNKLLKSGKGRGFLRAVSEMMGQSAIPYFYLVEKRYAICAKMVESLFDPSYNSAVRNEELWDPEARQGLAQNFYDGPEDLIYSFGAAYRAKDADAIHANAQQWLEHFRTQPGSDMATRITAVLPVLNEEMQGEFRAFDGTPTGYDSLNMPIWVMVFQDMEQHFSGPCDLIHDRIAEFQECFEQTYKLLRDGRPSRMLFKDGRTFTSGLQKVVSLNFAESKTEPLVRAADCIASSTREFAWRAFRGDSIDENLSKAVYPSLGALACWVLSHMHPSVGFFPQLGTLMASSQFCGKVFASIMETMRPAARRIQI
jgi:hypothetical protein